MNAWCHVCVSGRFGDVGGEATLPPHTCLLLQRSWLVS